jgi:RNA polymerase sigma factor (sigma-70 family)
VRLEAEQSREGIVTKKRPKHRPWLTGSGVEIPTAELKEICKVWDPSTWEAYLKWYGGGCREILLTPELYQQIGDEQIETIFEMFSKTETPAKRNLIERLLSHLPARDAEILRTIYLEGRTQVEVAAVFGVSQPRICQLKNGAFLRLKRGLAGDRFIARQYMRGVKESLPAPEPSLWDQPMDPPLNEDRDNNPGNASEFISRIKNHLLREAVLRLSQTAQLTVYWMFWSGTSLREVAQRLSTGTNNVDEVRDASVVKVKRHVIQFQTGNQI